jgi:hypothetical protein
MEKEIRSPQELVTAAEQDARWMQQYALRSDSVPGRFPYKFSIAIAGDRYQFELTREEVEALSNAPDLPVAVRTAFAIKTDPIRHGRVTFFQ